MSVEGMEELGRKLRELAQTNLVQATAQAIEIVRSAAVLNCHEDTGELRQSIHTEIRQNGDTVQGICYTNKAYAPYIEFGTGKKGQEHHAGISPDISPVYKMSPWWIHESQVDRRVAEKYRWFYMDTPQGRFYQCTGNPAYPFMYPALKDNEKEVLSAFKTGFKAEMKGK